MIEISFSLNEEEWAVLRSSMDPKGKANRRYNKILKKDTLGSGLQLLRQPPYIILFYALPLSVYLPFIVAHYCESR